MPPVLESLTRNYLSVDFKAESWDVIEPILNELSKREIPTFEDFERWLADRSEVQSVLSEERTRRHIARDCNTADEEAKRSFMDWLENIEPKLMPYRITLQKKIIESPYGEQLGDEFTCLLRRARNNVEIFCEKNIPLDVVETKLATEYSTIVGDQTVNFDGAEQTMPQMRKYLESADRTVREDAFRVMKERRSQDVAKLEDIFEKILQVRNDKAQNAGFENYRDLRWREFNRFDYTPENCLEFIDAIETVCMPRVQQQHAERREKLGIDTLRPWDMEVGIHGDAPLEPFADIDELNAKTLETFKLVDPLFSDYFRTMMSNGLLDLASRKGKSPGGYQATLTERRLPFIFMNASGSNSDVTTLLHEGGHAFHAIEHRDMRLHDNLGAPMEFCEVASMSMELMAGEHVHKTFYDEEGARRARIRHLERAISFMPWMATIDGFQHWLYTNPNHSRDERTKAWLDIFTRFNGDVDWAGFEGAKQYRWVQQLHLFGYAFYYVEYGIAQLGALQVWRNYLQDPKQAVKDYRHALSLGSSRSLPELFEAANIKFDFSSEMVGSLMTMVDEKLTELKA